MGVIRCVAWARMSRAVEEAYKELLITMIKYKKESVKELVGAFLNLKKMLSSEQLSKLHGICKTHVHAEEKEERCHS